MTMYRTGRHWGVTIVREGERPAELDDCAFCVASSTGCLIHKPVEAELVAVVVNGDQALAERICTLLNDREASARSGYDQAIATLLGVVERTGSPAARWCAEYLAVDPDKLAPKDVQL